MESGIPYGDIIVIGAIAAFILLRYRAMLGEKSGRDVTDIPRPRPVADLEPVIQLPEREAARKKSVLAPAETGPFADQLSAMRAIDPEFSQTDFLTGAKAAFEMVIDAYNSADHDTLKMLLSDRIYKEFKQSLDENARDGRTVHSTLVAIVKAEITDAKLRGNKATITVDFLSEQIPLVRNVEGEIIEGNASAQEAVEDEWIFERDLKNSDPAWKVIET